MFGDGPHLLPCLHHTDTRRQPPKQTVSLVLPIPQPFTTSPGPVKCSPKEVIMTIAMCNTPAALVTAPYESTDSIEMTKLTELVRGNDQRLLEQMRPLVRRQSVALDLASVQRIDAAGISALISLYTYARETGHSFTVSNASPRVAEIRAEIPAASM